MHVPFQKHRVIHLMRGLPVTSLLFILIHFACRMFLVMTLLDVCLTAVLQNRQVAFHTFMASQRQQEAMHQP